MCQGLAPSITQVCFLTVHFPCHLHSSSPEKPHSRASGRLSTSHFGNIFSFLGFSLPIYVKRKLGELPPRSPSEPMHHQSVKAETPSDLAKAFKMPNRGFQGQHIPARPWPAPSLWHLQDCPSWSGHQSTLEQETNGGLIPS
jgi:hypothetical protein